MRDYSRLIEGLEQFDIRISENQVKQFDMFYELLIETNRVMN